MRVQFEYTLDETVDAALRTLARSRSMKSAHLRDYLGGSLLMGFMAWGAAFLSLKNNPEERWLISAIAAILMGLYYPIFHRQLVKRRLRNYYRELLGGNGPYPLDIEVTPLSIILREKGRTTLIEWSEVESVQETADSIDILLGRGEIIVVRKRAFPSEESMVEFLKK